MKVKYFYLDFQAVKLKARAACSFREGCNGSHLPWTLYSVSLLEVTFKWEAERKDTARCATLPSFYFYILRICLKKKKYFFDWNFINFYYDFFGKFIEFSYYELINCILKYQINLYRTKRVNLYDEFLKKWIIDKISVKVISQLILE